MADLSSVTLNKYNMPGGRQRICESGARIVAARLMELA